MQDALWKLLKKLCHPRGTMSALETREVELTMTSIYDSGQWRECKFNCHVFKTSFCLRTAMFKQLYCFNTTEFNHFTTLAVALVFAISVWFIGWSRVSFIVCHTLGLIAVFPVKNSGSYPYWRTWYLFSHAHTCNFFCLCVTEEIFPLLLIADNAFWLLSHASVE